MLFDFGSECRISVKKLYHSRENGLIFQYYDKTAVQTLELHTNSSVMFNCIGIIRFSSTPYNKTTFEIVLGSVLRLPSYF